MFIFFLPQAILSQSQDKALRRIGELREVRPRTHALSFSFYISFIISWIETQGWILFLVTSSSFTTHWWRSWACSYYKMKCSNCTGVTPSSLCTIDCSMSHLWLCVCVSGAADGSASQEAPAGGVWCCSRGKRPDDHCPADSSVCLRICLC